VRDPGEFVNLGVEEEFHVVDRRSRERGLFRADVQALLDNPNGRRTTIGANVLWQVGLMELWLQRMGL
jgi:asparagine synthase (glutamine-hydrolysing)